MEVQFPPVFCLALIAVTMEIVEGFELLVFGGYVNGQNVQLYEKVFENSGCHLPHLPLEASFKPFGALMDNNITLCAGGLHTCYYLNDHEDTMQWVKSFPLESESASLITTYDNDVWSVFPGSGTENEVHKWSSGTLGFQKHELGFEYYLGSCSARKNQTHGIVSKGSRSIFWYQEDGNLIERWDDEGNNALLAGCGLVFDKETGYQFVIAGGFDGSEVLDRTEVFNFEDNLWSVGQVLPFVNTQAASVGFQNTFILIGGRAHDFQSPHDTLLQYDSKEGWIELPLRLGEPDFNIGVMRVPPGQLQCL